MKDLFKNLTKSWITTTIGVLIILASIASRFIPELGADWTEVGVGVGIGVLFLALPDPKNPKSNAVALFIALWLIGLALMSGCTTYQRCFDKYGSLQDTMYLTRTVQVEVPYEVITPGDLVYGNVDSLLSLLITDTLTVMGANNRAQAKFWRDKFNRARYEFNCPDDTTSGVLKTSVDVKVPCPPQNVFESPQPTGWRLYLDHYKTGCAYLVTAGIVFFTIKKIVT